MNREAPITSVDLYENKSNRIETWHKIVGPVYDYKQKDRDKLMPELQDIVTRHTST